MANRGPAIETLVKDEEGRTIGRALIQTNGTIKLNLAKHVTTAIAQMIIDDLADSITVKPNFSPGLRKD